MNRHPRSALPAFAPLGLTLLRTVIGLVFFMHGYQKVFDVGIAATQDDFAGLGIPYPGMMGAVIPILELVGGVLLISGLFSRVLALLFAGVSVVAAITVHLENGFYSQTGGFEYVLVLAMASLALVATGPGLFALDNRFPIRRRARGSGNPSPFSAGGPTKGTTSRPISVRP